MSCALHLSFSRKHYVVMQTVSVCYQHSGRKFQHLGSKYLGSFLEELFFRNISSSYHVLLVGMVPCFITSDGLTKNNQPTEKNNQSKKPHHISLFKIDWFFVFFFLNLALIKVLAAVLWLRNWPWEQKVTEIAQTDIVSADTSVPPAWKYFFCLDFLFLVVLN